MAATTSRTRKQATSNERGNRGERATARGVVAVVSAAQVAPFLPVSCTHPLPRPRRLYCPARPHQLLALLRSSVSASCTSPLVIISLLYFPTPRCQPFALLRSSAPPSYCAECHSVLLLATLSAPSPQSGFTSNEVWRASGKKNLHSNGDRR